MISLAIVAHPKRSKYVELVSAQIKPEAIAWDTDGHVGADQNHLKAWEWLSHSPEPWGVVLEDDALPCRDFGAQLRMALPHAPTPVVGLYLGRGRPLTVDGFDWPNRVAAGITKDVCWLTAPGLASCVGVAMRTELIPSMLKTVPWMLADRPIDSAIGVWAKKALGYDVSYCRPSLVDHRTGPSLIAERLDGQDRDGLTRTAFTEEGKGLPEVRRAWLFDYEPNRDLWDGTFYSL